jgi:hypothetical protein
MSHHTINHPLSISRLRYMTWKEEAEHQVGLRKNRTNVSPCETEYHCNSENLIRYLSAGDHTGNRPLLPSALRHMVYKEKGRVLSPLPLLRMAQVCCHTCRSSLANAPGGTRRITCIDPPARYWPGADTRCRGRPHQQTKDCLICFASSSSLPVRQGYTICVTSYCSPKSRSLPTCKPNSTSCRWSSEAVSRRTRKVCGPS